MTSKKCRKKSKVCVFRRLAVWRKVADRSVQNVYHLKTLAYVSLDGVIYPKNTGYSKARLDEMYLQMLCISKSGRESGLNSHYRRLKPFVDAWSPDVHSLFHWYIPKSVIKCYNLLGVHELYTWQVKCLEKSLGNQSPEIIETENFDIDQKRDRLQNMRSIVYSAPTSGGKSLVAEILMIRAALFCGKSSLLILPHVSLCEERVTYLRSILGQNSVGLRIEAFHANDGSIATWSSNVDIAVCTIEKANGIMNRLISELMQETELRQPPYETNIKNDPAITNLGIVVLDEIHLIGDSQRGFLLELLLTKIRRLATLVKEKNLEVLYNEPISIRFVGLSATLPNLKEVAFWLNAEIYETDVRPLPLQMFYKIDNKLMEVLSSGEVKLSRTLPQFRYHCSTESTNHTVYKDSEHLGYLVAESMARQEQCLVFCATKEWCEKACLFLTKILPHYLTNEECSKKNEDAEELIDALSIIAPTRSEICPIIAEGIPQRVSYHHAGMTTGERCIIENAFRKGQLLVLCATSTLAVGVNLPVARVIFRSTQIGRELLNSTRLKQMAGRAGRKGFDVKGEAIVLCSNDYDATRTARLLSSPAESVRSVVTGLRLCQLILELIVLRLANTPKTILDVIKTDSFSAYQGTSTNCTTELKESIEEKTCQNVSLAFQFLYANATLNTCDSETRVKTIIQPLDAFSVMIPFFSTSSSQLRKLARHFPEAFLKFKLLQSVFKSDNKLPLLFTKDIKSEESNRSLDVVDFLIKGTSVLEATPLGVSIIESAIPVSEGVLLFSELYRVRTQGIFLKTELHLLYLVTPTDKTHDPYAALSILDSFIQKLDSRSILVAEFYGINPKSTRAILQSRLGGNIGSQMLFELWISKALTLEDMISFYKLFCHIRFYHSLILYDIFHEAPMESICSRYSLQLGVLLSIKQSAVLQAGKVATFCERLQWYDLSALFRRLSDKLNTAYRIPECMELRAINLLQERQAKALFDGNLRTLKDVASASIMDIFFALEPLGRTEILSGDENKEFFFRQARRRAFLAKEIQQSARKLLQGS